MSYYTGEHWGSKALRLLTFVLAAVFLSVDGSDWIWTAGYRFIALGFLGMGGFRMHRWDIDEKGGE